MSYREVSGLVAALAVLNVLVAYLLTAMPLPAWLELHRLASDLDTAVMMGAAHVGAACLLILVAARRLFVASGRGTQLFLVGGLTLLATLVSLNRYWAHPVHQQVPTHVVTEPTGVPLHGALPGGR